MTEEQFEQALKAAKPGDEIVYHTGFHCMNASGIRMPTAHAAWRAYIMERVVLYQRRLAPGKLNYCAKVIK